MKSHRGVENSQMKKVGKWAQEKMKNALDGERSDIKNDALM